MKITDSIKYVGVNDHQIDLFEGQYVVQLGMAYNSYVILDEKILSPEEIDRILDPDSMTEQGSIRWKSARIKG